MSDPTTRADPRGNADAAHTNAESQTAPSFPAIHPRRCNMRANELCAQSARTSRRSRTGQHATVLARRCIEAAIGRSADAERSLGFPDNLWINDGLQWIDPGEVILIAGARLE
jgi:hypothetical protein